MNRNLFTKVTCWYTPPSPGQTPPWADPPLKQIIPPRKQTPPGRQTSPQQTATAADGTHPTLMHSCYRLFPKTKLHYKSWIVPVVVVDHVIRGGRLRFWAVGYGRKLNDSVHLSSSDESTVHADEWCCVFSERLKWKNIRHSKLSEIVWLPLHRLQCIIIIMRWVTGSLGRSFPHSELSIICYIYLLFIQGLHREPKVPTLVTRNGIVKTQTLHVYPISKR